MAGESKSTLLVAMVSAISAVFVAGITTYGTIAVSEPEAKRVKKELAEISELQLIANLPIGTIVPSMLQPSLFAKVVGDPSVFDPEKSKWVFADKQKDITISRYGQLLNNRRYTPDLRGVFLRGMNEGRIDGDPDHDRRPGDIQQDALQKHGHETTAKGLKWGEPSEVPTASDLGYTTKGNAHAPEAQVTIVKDANVADETRPKNVAVYFYIKIN
jgi:hypothetical protein